MQGYLGLFWDNRKSFKRLFANRQRSNQDYPAGLGHRATGFEQLNGGGDSFTLVDSSGSGLPG
jgi:hypothetical protein